MAALLVQTAGCKKSGEEQGPGVKEDPVWIRVNGTDVLRSEVETEISRVVSQLSSQMPPDQIGSIESTVKRDVMQRSAQKIVLDQAVEKDGIKVEEAEVEGEIKNIKDQFPDPAVFQQKLDEMGITESELRADITRGLGYQKLMNKNADVPEPAEEEVLKVYESAKSRMLEPAKVMTRHILLSLPPVVSEEEKQKKKEEANSILKRIKKGEDIGALAQEFSESPTKNEGGKESFNKGQMPEAFDTEVFGLKPGELSSVIETPMGVHIVKVEEQVPERTTPLEEVKDDIVQFLKESRKREAMEKYVSSLMEEAKIEYIEPLPEAKAMPGQGSMPPGEAEPSPEP